MSITTCLMTSNWHEFHLALGLAEDRGIGVGVNVVRLPTEHSLYQLPADELAEVVTTMRATQPALTGAAAGGLDRAPGGPGAPAGDPLPGRGSRPTSHPRIARSSSLPLPPVDGRGSPSRSSDPAPAPSPCRGCGAGDGAGRGHRRRDRRGLAGRRAPLRRRGGRRSGVDGLGGALAEAFGDPDAWELAERVPDVDDDRFWTWMPAAGAVEAHELIGRGPPGRRAGGLVGADLVLRPWSRPPGQAWT